uniref:Uncharacterized protein n=1 Tax=Rousettus aegyptiacus TaxID=9407 RepID=A0A7J8BEP4_ROUAE|nr:hypothetical protein HJG63_009814 [Rousettus aegyptiacus]
MRREPSQDRTSFHHRDARTYTHSDWDNLDMPVNLMCTSLGHERTMQSRRKPMETWGEHANPTPHSGPGWKSFFFFFFHLQHYNGITLVKDYYIPTVEYYSGIKRNKVLIHPITWMNLKNIMLHERSQTPKVTHNV